MAYCDFYHVHGLETTCISYGKNFFYLTTKGKGRKEGNVLFNDALNTFYLRFIGISHMVKDHSDSEKGNLLPPHRLLFTINSNGSFIPYAEEVSSIQL